ncbi:MAG: DUF389 domain-containing protein [Prevotellaceae bacterium]|jgi:uncharacterized hydrophobic protein (TIGR00271 family)|nr:DUF389 domain-containing protein [Prevotellaceae bacterium]
MRRLLRKIRTITNLADHIDVMATIASIKQNVDFRGPNVWILAFAIIIASVGLNVNSIPVIIGAMLISPLMGPIMGVGMSIAINDSKLLQGSLKNLLVMVAISLLASCTYFFISPLHLEAPTELLARTQPTIFDVFIALFGGLAGIVESARKEKGTVIAGVAIATALMPPLCTAGYGLANAQWGYFIGAFYLFFINSFLIALATFLMARYMKFPVVKFNDPVKQRHVNRIIIIFSTITLIPSIIMAWMVIRENRFYYAVDKLVKEYASAFENTKLMDVEKTYHVWDSSELKISTIGQPLTAFQIERIKEYMREAGLGKTKLGIMQSLSFASDNTPATELLQSIYERSEAAVKSKEERIAQLEKELSELKTEHIPYAQIARELAITYPALRKITLSAGRQIDVVSGKNTRLLVGVVNWHGTPATEELTQLENFLKVRLNEDHITIIPYAE